MAGRRLTTVALYALVTEKEPCVETRDVNLRYRNATVAEAYDRARFGGPDVLLAEQIHPGDVRRPRKAEQRSDNEGVAGRALAQLASPPGRWSH